MHATYMPQFDIALWHNVGHYVFYPDKRDAVPDTLQTL